MNKMIIQIRCITWGFSENEVEVLPTRSVQSDSGVPSLLLSTLSYLCFSA